MPAEKFKTELCNVLSYNKSTRELDIDFLGYGIRLHNVEKDIGNTILVKYRGEIGNDNFICKLQVIIMCNNCYEKFVERSGKVMLLCHMKDNESTDLLKICNCQRYCSGQDKYIPHKQKEGCKLYG